MAVLKLFGKKTGVNTQTTMNMQHFHDFYFLQALEAAVTMELSSKPELEFSKAVDKFRDDLDRTIEKIVPNMALRTFMYLYAACLGEARHARDTVARQRFLRANNGSERESWFAKVTEYPPTKQNLNTLLEVFSQDWRSGYGGDAWYDIAYALVEYETTPPAAWLDHVVDLEHNNGTAFSKPDGIYTIFFDVSYPDRFSSFLDYKFAKDILTKKPSFTSELFVSPKIHSLLGKYSTIFNKPVVGHVSPELDNLTDYSVEWGSNVLELDEKWCDWMDVSSDRGKPTVNSLLSVSGLHDFYIGYYTKEQFLDKVEECKQRAIAKVNPKFMNPYLKSKINKEIKKFIENNIDGCKKSKAEKVFSIMPCTAKANGKKTILYFKLPYQEGYGTKTDDGFTVEVDLACRVEGDGHVERLYGDLVIWINENHYWTSSATLEALVE